MLIKSYKYAGGLILRSKNFAVSLAELISVAGQTLNPGEASRVFTEFGQFSYQMPDDIKLTLSAAWHGPSVIPGRGNLLLEVALMLSLSSMRAPESGLGLRSTGSQTHGH